MKVGTRSILFGYHAFWLHPFMVAWAWWKLYGFPRDWRLWAAFFLHDIGYIGRADMDGIQGESHPERGAMILYRITKDPKWYYFCLYHSRQYARMDNRPFSRLCIADKLAGCLYPNWLAIGLCKLSGELKEYMVLFKRATPLDWAEQYRIETLKWIELNYNEAEINRSDRRSYRRGIANNRVS